MQKPYLQYTYSLVCDVIDFIFNLKLFELKLSIETSLALPTVSYLYLNLLKELRNLIINQSYFCVRHKNRQKHNQHFKAAVFHNRANIEQNYKLKTKDAEARKTKT